MSSFPEHSRFHFPDETFHSAQRSRYQGYVEDEEPDSASEQLSDVLSPHDTPTREQMLEKPDLISRTKDDGRDGTQRALNERSDEDLPSSLPLPSRPNKFHGPASTWRNWTVPERDLASSLDQLTAKDLGVHLYNAFKLKRREEGRDERRHSKTSEERHEVADRDGWKPPKVWTAWPLPPEVVPREEEETHWAKKVPLPAPYIGKPKMPGDALRVLIVAQILRKARLRFADRDSDNVDTVRGGLKILKPVVMADDERASEILRPTVQHVLTEFDALLMGLHHARSAVCLPMNDSASQYRSISRGRRASQGNAKKRKKGAPSKNTNTRSTSDMLSESESDYSMASKSKSGSKSKVKDNRPFSDNSNARKVHRHKTRLGLRDWSDVLGVASMTGWDSAVVEEAAARCASLFGENIKFRTLAEGVEGYTERRYLDGSVTSTVITKAKEATSKAKARTNEIDLVGGVHVDGYLEPIEGKKAWKYHNKVAKRGRGRPRTKQ
ncbi:hypothetical protein N7G274_008883 [Stereocaulon virgatum]|uniref:Rrn9 domain-containing protein n=1 Tax=Stereocaulon virgatum TaxID=373712 RepID=A0ABR3ZX49_9LECA